MIYDIIFIALMLGGAWCAWKISVADWRRRIIPDVYLFPLMLIGLTVVNCFSWPVTPTDSTIAAVGGYVLTALIGFLFERTRHTGAHTPPPIGMGDIKLMATGGIWLGTTGLALALIFACITGALWGIRTHQRYIPLAPFFVLGGFLSLIAITFLI